MDTIGESPNGNASIFTGQFNKSAVKIFAEESDLSEEVIGEMVRDTVIYTHGLAVMMIFANFRLPKEEACRMIYALGEKLLKGAEENAQKPTR